MTTALTYLGWTLVLAFAQVFLASAAKRGQDGGLKWAAGNRDAEPTYTGLAGRMVRAQANMFETLPVFVGGVLLAHAAARDASLTAWGAGLFFWARLVYVPVYAAGLTPWRSIVWGVAMVGLVLVLISLI